MMEEEWEKGLLKESQSVTKHTLVAPRALFVL